MRNIIYSAIFSLLSVVIFLSCGGTHDEKILNEDKMIDQLLTYMQGTTFEPKIIDSVKIIDGVSRALYIKGDEACPVSKGDSVYFYFTAYVIIGNSSFYIYDTNNKEDAKVAGLDTISRNFTPKGIIAGSGQVISGLDKGLLMCYLGEQSFLIFNSDLGYGSNSLGIVPPYSPLMFQVQIVGIKKN